MIFRRFDFSTFGLSAFRIFRRPQIGSLFLEHLWRLLALLAVVEYVLLVMWSRRRTKSSARAVWIGVLGMAALAYLNVSVDTPREKIIGVCHTLAALVDGGQVDRLAPHLSTDFKTQKLDRTAFVERVEQALTRRRIDNLSLRGFDVVQDGPIKATVVFNAACGVRTSDQMFDRLLSRWRLTFRLQGDRWRVSKIEVIPTPFSPLRDLSQWLP